MTLHPLAGLGLILVLGVSAQWLAWRLRLPAILLLLVAGLVVGPGSRLLGAEQPWLDPDALFGSLLLPLVSIFVAVILFEGGLSLRIGELRGAGAAVWRLVTFGAGITWLLASLAARYVLGLPTGVAMLLGAVLIVTGPTVIGPLLRYVRPTGPVGAVLKWEGIVIDPVGAVAAVLVFQVLAPHEAGHAGSPAIALLRTLVIGGGLGLAAGALLTWLLRHHWVPDELQSPVTLMLAIAAFVLSNLAQDEAGLLAVTVMGILLANQKHADIHHIVEFKENLRTLLISSIFIVLAARLPVEQLRTLDLRTGAFLLVLILLVRPASVWLSTLGTPLKAAERLFLAAVAPRGIVAAAIASTLAIALEHAGVAGAQRLATVTFGVIIGTVLVYGLLAAPLAQRLGLAVPDPQGLLIVGAHDWARRIAAVLREHHIRTLLVDRNRDHVLSARMDGLEAVAGDILADETLDALDLGGIGRLLALTPNDGVNALACRHLAPLLGRSNVYQLPGRGREHEPLPAHLRGRRLFRDDATFAELGRRFARGDVLKATPLTDQFDFQAFAARYGDDALLLFALTSDGRLHIATADAPLDPQPGQTVIALVPDRGEAAPAGS